MKSLEEKSLVVVLTGVRGGGKTLLLTGLGMEKLYMAKKLEILRAAKHNDNLFPRRKINVWSNYPISGRAKIPGIAGLVSLESSEIVLPDLMSWRPYFQNGYILYDEADQDMDRQDWQSQFPKYIVKGIKLIRHRNLSIITALQFIDELNIRLYKQADIIIQCKDIAFTPWGLSNDLAEGEIISTVWIDKSGICTGRAFNESGIIYKLRYFGKRFWENYETTHEFDVMKPKLKIELETYLIKDAESEYKRMEELSRLEQSIKATIEYYKYSQPGQQVKSVDFWQKSKEFGFDGEPKGWGKYLTQIGVEIKGRSMGYARYSFDSVDLEPVGESA